MNEKQFQTICDKLDKIYAIMLVREIEDKDDKIYTLKILGFGYKDIGPFVNMQDVRKTKGWKRK